LGLDAARASGRAKATCIRIVAPVLAGLFSSIGACSQRRFICEYCAGVLQIAMPGFELLARLLFLTYGILP
jgi:hypothetical protein